MPSGSPRFEASSNGKHRPALQPPPLQSCPHAPQFAGSESTFAVHGFASRSENELVSQHPLEPSAHAAKKIGARHRTAILSRVPVPIVKRRRSNVADDLMNPPLYPDRAPMKI